MNRGTMRGFTWSNLPSDATFPEMKVRWFPYRATYEVGSGEVDTVCWVDTTGGDVTININTRNMKDGQCIHFANYGTNSIIVTNSPGNLYCAGTAQTRTQYSVMTAMLLNSYYDEVLVFGDITV